MIYAQNNRYDVVLKQQSATNGATLTSDVIDTMGYDYCEIVVHGTTSDNATNNPATLKVTECDTTVATDFANVSGFVGDTDFTIPNSPTATTTAPFAIFGVDTRKRKRYLKVLVSPLTTQTFSVIAIQGMGRSAQAPVGTTDQNVAVIVNG